jgi:hypothetical protein
MLPLRMIIFLLAINLDWMPGTVCVVVGVFIAAMVLALRCACVDGSTLVLSDCIVCAAVLVERWCWYGALISLEFLYRTKSLHALASHSLNTRIRCFRVRSVWFENLVVDAMASEACCLLKAILSDDAVALFKSRGLRSFACVHNVVVLIFDTNDFTLCEDAEAFLSLRKFFMQQVSFHGGQCIQASA